MALHATALPRPQRSLFYTTYEIDWLMKSKMQKGILLGLLAGIVDVIPMILQNLSWDANLSAFTHWVVAGFVISVADIPIKGAVKGLVLSLLLLLPVAILVGWQEPMSLIPILIMTVILGSALGYLIDK